MNKPSQIAWLMLLAIALIWGSSFILIKKGLVGLSAMQVGAYRVFAAGIFMMPLAIVNLKKISFHKIYYLLPVGLLGSFIPSLLFATAQTKIGSGVAGTLNALTPILTVIIGAIFFHQKHSKLMWLGVLIGFLGSFLLIFSSHSDDVVINTYAFLILIASLSYAINAHITKKTLNEESPVAVTSISLLLISPFIGIYLFGFTDFWSRITQNAAAQESLIYISLLGVVGSGIAYVIFYKLLQITSALFVTSVTYLLPVVAVFWGLIDGEVFSMYHFFGMFIIAAGVYLSNKRTEAKEDKQ